MISPKQRFAIPWVAIVLLWTAPIPATPPFGDVPAVTPPGGREEGGFDWQGIVGGILRGAPEERRPQPRYYPGSSSERYYPGSRSAPPQGYGQPEYVQPAVPFAPRVTPERNIVTVAVPAQPSPLEGRVSEVSTREARCYAKELEVSIQQSLAAVLGTLGKGNAEAVEIQRRIAALQEMLDSKVRWPEIEPVLQRLLESRQANSQPAFREALQRILPMILVRDAFMAVGFSDPRGRSGALPVAALPTGMIWIVYDPALRFGTALYVTDTIMVCGTGGQGDVQVVNTSLAAALGMPVVPGDPVPDADPAELVSLADAIVINNPKDSGSTVNYVLNGRYPYSIEAGTKQKLNAAQSWVIEFDRGNNQGTARYQLTRGVYEFRVIRGMWELVRVKFDITIDNREGVQDFRYVLNNEIVTVRAGESTTHTDDKPISIEFDDGEGPGQPAVKNLNKSGTYKVAVNTQTNYLDLYAMGESKKEPLADATN